MSPLICMFQEKNVDLCIYYFINILPTSSAILQMLWVLRFDRNHHYYNDSLWTFCDRDLLSGGV